MKPEKITYRTVVPIQYILHIHKQAHHGGEADTPNNSQLAF